MKYPSKPTQFSISHDTNQCQAAPSKLVRTECNLKLFGQRCKFVTSFIVRNHSKVSMLVSRPLKTVMDLFISRGTVISFDDLLISYDFNNSINIVFCDINVHSICVYITYVNVRLILSVIVYSLCTGSTQTNIDGWGNYKCINVSTTS